MTMCWSCVWREIVFGVYADGSWDQFLCAVALMIRLIRKCPHQRAATDRVQRVITVIYGVFEIVPRVVPDGSVRAKPEVLSVQALVPCHVGGDAGRRLSHVGPGCKAGSVDVSVIASWNTAFPSPARDRMGAS